MTLITILIPCLTILAADAKSQTPAKEITTKSGIVMISLPGGTFTMGSDQGAADAKPAHKVTLSPFYMDKYEVTQDTFQALTGFNPSKWEGKKSPLESLRWRQAVKYCNARSKKEGLKPCYEEKTGKCDFTANGYRLPTEAEWEYACRAGTTTNYSFGNDPEQLRDYAWFKKNSGKKPHFVGEKKPNPWGLCDLHGNVWEWCNDYYDPEYYKKSPEKDPRGPEKGTKKVLRGGSWDNKAESCTSFYRYSDNPACSDICLGYDIYGFRCVRNAEKTK